MTFTIELLVHFHNIKTCVKDCSGNPFEERKKIATKSLAEGNAHNIQIKKACLKNEQAFDKYE
jgi:hypothetical protein